MRKKGFIFALLCITLSTFFAFGLTACETDGGTSGGGSETPSKAKYTVTFVFDDGNETIEIEEGSVISEKDFPKKSGYGISCDYDFTKPITENVTIPAVWKQVFTVEGSSITGTTDFGKTLKYIEIPSSIDGNAITSIGSYAFRGCKLLTSITIGNGVMSIGDTAFYNCSSLSRDNGYVAKYALNVKKGGTSDIVNSNGYLFYTYNNVNYLLGYIGTDTELTLPNGYNEEKYEIYKYAFYYSDSLTSVTVPDKVTCIEIGAFWGCTSLSSVTIGNSVTSIRDCAFYDCKSLSSISIGSNVGSIGAGTINRHRDFSFFLDSGAAFIVTPLL